MVFDIRDMLHGLGYLVSSIFTGKGLPDGDMAGPIGIAVMSLEVLLGSGFSHMYYNLYAYHYH